MEEQKKRNSWFEWVKTILISVFIAVFIKSFVLSTSIVEGESMAPTLKDGNRIIFNKFIYLIDKPKRGDIVIIKKPSKSYVKRIIALPGETIEMKDGTLYINHEAYEQNFITDDLVKRTAPIDRTEVPPGSYYVMGDNRPISKDSRDLSGFGFIKEEQIIGRSEIIFYPFDEWSLTR